MERDWFPTGVFSQKDVKKILTNGENCAIIHHITEMQ